MSKKTFQEELGDLEEWEGAIPVRHRWVEHGEPRRHGEGGERDDRPARRKLRRRPPHGGEGPGAD